MSMQYLSPLYIWLHNMVARALIWEHEDVQSYKRIINHFRNTHFMWRDCKVEIY